MVRTALLTLALSAAVAAQSAGKRHKDDRWGFSVRTPRGWKSAGAGANDTEIAAKFLGRRALAPKKTIMAGPPRKPEMWILGFPRGDGAKDPVARYTALLTGPFAAAGLKPRLLMDETGEHDGVSVRKLAHRIDMGGIAGTQSMAWVYAYDDIHFVVHFQVMDEHWEDHQKTFEKCLASFERIERRRALPGREAAGGGANEVEDRFRREIESLPEDWTHERTAHYLVLSNADARFTRKTRDHAEAMRRVFEETFGTLGGGEAPPAVIRVFKDAASETAFRRGKPLTTREVTVAERRDFLQQSVYGTFNQALFRQWLSGKSPGMWLLLPDWLRSGWAQHVRFYETRGKRAVFKQDAINKREVRDAAKEGRFTPLKQMLQEEAGRAAIVESVGIGTFDGFALQAGAVVHWLTTKGDRGRTKGVFERYVKAVADAAGPVDTGDLGLVDPAELEAGGDALEKAQEQIKRSRGARGRISEEAFAAVFGDWTADDWDAAERAFASFAK